MPYKIPPELGSTRFATAPPGRRAAANIHKQSTIVSDQRVRTDAGTTKEILRGIDTAGETADLPSRSAAIKQPRLSSRDSKSLPPTTGLPETLPRARAWPPQELSDYVTSPASIELVRARQRQDPLLASAAHGAGRDRPGDRPRQRAPCNLPSRRGHARPGSMQADVSPYKPAGARPGQADKPRRPTAEKPATARGPAAVRTPRNGALPQTLSRPVSGLAGAGSVPDSGSAGKSGLRKKKSPAFMKTAPVPPPVKKPFFQAAEPFQGCDPGSPDYLRAIDRAAKKKVPAAWRPDRSRDLRARALALQIVGAVDLQRSPLRLYGLSLTVWDLEKEQIFEANFMRMVRSVLAQSDLPDLLRRYREQIRQLVPSSAKILLTKTRSRYGPVAYHDLMRLLPICAPLTDALLATMAGNSRKAGKLAPLQAFFHAVDEAFTTLCLNQGYASRADINRLRLRLFRTLLASHVLPELLRDMPGNSREAEVEPLILTLRYRLRIEGARIMKHASQQLSENVRAGLEALPKTFEVRLAALSGLPPWIPFGSRRWPPRDRRERAPQGVAAWVAGPLNRKWTEPQEGGSPNTVKKEHRLRRQREQRKPHETHQERMARQRHEKDGQPVQQGRKEYRSPAQNGRQQEHGPDTQRELQRNHRPPARNERHGDHGAHAQHEQAEQYRPHVQQQKHARHDSGEEFEDHENGEHQSAARVAELLGVVERKRSAGLELVDNFRAEPAYRHLPEEVQTLFSQAIGELDKNNRRYDRAVLEGMLEAAIEQHRQDLMYRFHLSPQRKRIMEHGRWSEDALLKLASERIDGRQTLTPDWSQALMDEVLRAAIPSGAVEAKKSAAAPALQPEINSPAGSIGSNADSMKSRSTGSFRPRAMGSFRNRSTSSLTSNAVSSPASGFASKPGKGKAGNFPRNPAAGIASGPVSGHENSGGNAAATGSGAGKPANAGSSENAVTASKASMPALKSTL